jgi:hypothetical protein
MEVEGGGGRRLSRQTDGVKQNGIIYYFDSKEGGGRGEAVERIGAGARGREKAVWGQANLTFNSSSLIYEI